MLRLVIAGCVEEGMEYMVCLCVCAPEHTLTVGALGKFKGIHFKSQVS